VNSGLVHTVSVTPTNIPDIEQLPHLLREDGRAVFGDKGYASNRGANRRFNRRMSSIQARVEHVFRVIKRQFGYTKAHYRWIAKNAAQVLSLGRPGQSLSGKEGFDGLTGDIRPLAGARSQNVPGKQHIGGGKTGLSACQKRPAWAWMHKGSIDQRFLRSGLEFSLIYYSPNFFLP
jgi:hypothetical protein